MNTRILLEVAIESVDDATTAEAAGADRLELCAALDLGGLTPSIATIAHVRRAAGVPLMVMIRPRAGGFDYSERELSVMEADIDAALQAGADGLVFGVLRADGQLDPARMERLVRRCGDAQTVCHRAFDCVPDPPAALESLIDLGVTRVLTSGQRPQATTPEAMALIRQLREQAAGRIELLPGSGVRASNVAELIRTTGCTQVHGSFRTRRRDASTSHTRQVTLETRNESGESTFGATDGQAVAAVRSVLDERCTL